MITANQMINEIKSKKSIILKKNHEVCDRQKVFI